MAIVGGCFSIQKSFQVPWGKSKFLSGKVYCKNRIAHIQTKTIIVDVSGDEGKAILTLKSSVIARFIHVMTSLARVYNLNLANLHIFYDTKGVLIAFNRNGSIFLNLRYYEAWRECIY